MKLEMNPKDQRPIKQEIRRLERRLKRLRKRLKISDRNEVIALYDRNAFEADGLGGARVVRATKSLRGPLSGGRQPHQPSRI